MVNALIIFVSGGIKEHKDELWIGYNNTHYDQYIAQGILCQFNPWDINDWIINKQQNGWSFSRLLQNYPMINYDVMTSGSLKELEGFMGEIKNMPNRNPSYTHTCDVVDREDVLDIIDSHTGKENQKKCRNCKWWKDNDGVYRRGVYAESKCPINTKEVYDGDAYCYKFNNHIGKEQE